MTSAGSVEDPDTGALDTAVPETGCSEVFLSSAEVLACPSACPFGAVFAAAFAVLLPVEDAAVGSASVFPESALPDGDCVP